MQFQQEYLGMFVGGIKRLFPDDLINKVCTLSPKTLSGVRGDYFQGIDIARMGGDEIVLISANRINKEFLEMFDLTIPDGQKITDTARLIIHKDKQINHKKIYMDDGGLGVGVYDILLEDPQTKNKVIGLNNAKRSIDDLEKGKERVKTLLGEDMGVNLLVLMEHGKIKLFDDPRVIQSLRSMQYDYGDAGKFKIHGNYDHIYEALKRVAWSMKNKTLNMFVRSF